MDLGSLMDPAQQGAGGGEDLAAKLQNPILRNALLSAGLQMMTGGWGNSVQQIAAGLGAGAQGAGDTAAGIQKVAQHQADQQFAAEQGAATRASHEKVAQITGESREAAAQVRGLFSIERARIALEKASPNDAIHYRAEARKILENNITNMASFDDVTKTRMIEEKAATMYQNDLDRGWVRRPGGGLVPPTQGPGSASSVGQPQSMGNSSAQTPVPTGKKTSVSLDTLLADPTFGKQLALDLSTPEGQARVLKANPGLAREIDLWMRRQQLQNLPGQPLQQQRGFAFPLG